MSKSQYTIRGFKPFSELQFDTLGLIEKFNSFDTKVVEKQHEVLVEMLTGPLGISARTLASNPTLVGTVVDARSDKTLPMDEVIILNLTLEVNVDKDALRDVRPLLVESFTRWAEKSRVRGSRGWRCSAVRTPTFEKNVDPSVSAAYLMKVQVILSNAIFYDQTTVKVGVNSDIVLKDLQNLKRHVNSVTGGLVNTVRFDHSVIGKGRV